MIDRIYKTVNFFVNTDGRGNVAPTRFTLALHNAVLSRHEGYLALVTEMTNKQNRGLMNGGLENMPERIREKIQHFLATGSMTISGNSYPLPDDCQYVDTIITPSGRSVSLAKDAGSMQVYSQLNLTRATADFPQGIRLGRNISISPAVTGDLTIYYLRAPKFAKWTFVVVDDVEQFNPDANDYQDVDMHPSEETALTLQVLQAFGINLKEQDLLAAANNIEAKKMNQENSI